MNPRQPLPLIRRWYTCFVSSMGERSAADSWFSSLALRRVNSESTGFRSASASIFQPNACNPAALMPTPVGDAQQHGQRRGCRRDLACGGKPRVQRQFVNHPLELGQMPGACLRQLPQPLPLLRLKFADALVIGGLQGPFRRLHPALGVRQARNVYPSLRLFSLFGSLGRPGAYSFASTWHDVHLSSWPCALATDRRDRPRGGPPAMFEPCAPDRQLTGGSGRGGRYPTPLGVAGRFCGDVRLLIVFYCLVLKPAGLVLPVFTSWHCLAQSSSELRVVRIESHVYEFDSLVWIMIRDCAWFSAEPLVFAAASVLGVAGACAVWVSCEHLPAKRLMSLGVVWVASTGTGAVPLGSGCRRRICVPVSR